jgi:hypothetical protein
MTLYEDFASVTFENGAINRITNINGRIFFILLPQIKYITIVRF